MAITPTKPTTKWHPTAFLEANPSSSALVILNQPITDILLLKRLWQHSELAICADGGANRLYDALHKSDDPDLTTHYVPDEICGDLDSVRPEVLKHYEGLGVGISSVQCQYSTDFMKCLDRIAEWRRKSGRRLQAAESHVLVLGGLGGRVDQALHILHQLFVTAAAADDDDDDDTRRPGQRIWLFSEDSISFVLERGRNEISTRLSAGYLGKTIGIVPMGGRAHITTKGLEWDVVEWEAEFGKRISTSNHVTADVIQVDTTERVLFTIERSTEIMPACKCGGEEAHRWPGRDGDGDDVLSLYPVYLNNLGP